VRRVMIAVFVSMLLVSVSAPVLAEGVVVQMLGLSSFEGDLGSVNSTYGTNLDPAVTGNFGDYACFEMPLLNTTSNKQIGFGIDCLRFEDGTAPIVGAEFHVTAVSFFVLPGGVLVNMGTTTIQPFVPGFGDAGGTLTHVTGSVPTPGTTNTFIAGTGRFQNRIGTARVSGAVDVTGVAAGTSTPSFDCLWKIDLLPNS